MKTAEELETRVVELEGSLAEAEAAWRETYDLAEKLSHLLEKRVDGYFAQAPAETVAIRDFVLLEAPTGSGYRGQGEKAARQRRSV